MLRTPLLLVGLWLLASGCATIDESSTLQPGERPKTNSTEAGFWMAMDKAEENIKYSGMVVRDPELNAYVKNLVCQLAESYCKDVRVYILNANQFNAAMAPNGMMMVWTGALLRVQNEAQLAAILGHELVHFKKRHTLKRYLDLRAKANALAWVGMGLAPVGGGLISLLGQAAAYGAIMSYSRDHEREADAEGLKLMAAQGYSPEAAAQIWENLLEEQEAGDRDEDFIFFATHPAPEERMETMRRQAAEIQPGVGTRDDAEAYLKVTQKYRDSWLADELRRGKFKETEVVLKNLPPSSYRPGETYYFRGELIRLKRDSDYLLQASGQYQKAIDLDPTDPRPQRALGLLLWKTDQKNRARKHLEKYMELKPDAMDIAIIKDYLNP